MNLSDEKTEELTPIATTTGYSKKRKLILIFIGITVLTLGVMGIFLFTTHQHAQAFQKELNLGEKYLAEGNYEEALLSFDKAISIDSKNLEAYYGKAQAYVNNKAFEKAEAVLLEARKITPDAETNILLIRVYDHTQKSVEANALLAETAVLLESNISKTNDKNKLVELYDQLISVYRRFGKDSETINDLFDEALARTDNQKYDSTKLNSEMVNSSGNIINGDIAIFYNLDTFYATGNKLFKLSSDGTIDLVFETGIDYSIGSLNIKDDFIYYTLHNKISKNNGINYVTENDPKQNTLTNLNGLYKMKIDDNSTTKLLSSDYIQRVRINGEKLFFIDSKETIPTNYSYQLCTMDLNGSNRSTLLSASNYFIVNELIYYVKSDYTIQRTQLDGTKDEALKAHDIISSYNIIVDEEYFYFINYGHSLYRSELDVSDTIPLGIEGRYSSFNLADGWIYCGGAEDHTISKMKLDGSEQTTIVKVDAKDSLGNPSNQSFEISSINIVNDQIYYTTKDSNDYLSYYTVTTSGTNNKRLYN